MKRYCLLQPCWIALVAFALLLFCLHGQAQNKSAYYPHEHGQPKLNFRPDTINIEFPQHHAVVRFSLKRYTSQKQFVHDFPAILGDIVATIVKGLDDTVKAHTVTVVFKPNEEKRITLAPATATTSVTTRGDTVMSLLPPGWEVRIESSDASTYVYAETFADLRRLATESFLTTTSTIDADPGMRHVGKKSINARLLMRDGKIVRHKIQQQYPGDMLALTLGAGAGVVQNRFYPDIEGTAGFYFTDHFSRFRYRFELSYNLMVFAARSSDNQYASNLNGFLSVAYGVNFNRRQPRERWTTIGAGWLVNKQGDLFKGNTMKIFFSSDIGSTKLNIVPELYLTDDVKKALYGIKLRYTF